MIGAYGLLRAHALGSLLSSSSYTPIARAGLYTRVINLPAILLFYIKSFFFPLTLSSSYQWVITTVSFEHVVLPLFIDVVFFGLVAFGAIHLFKHARKQFYLYLFFSLWFIVGLSIHLQIIPLDSTVAERWFYVPMLGLLGMIGVLLQTRQFKITHRWGIVIGLVIVALSIRTFVRSFDWRNELTLDMHDVNVSHAYDLENGIGNQFIKEGKYEEAKIHIDRSIALYPYFTNTMNLGVIYTDLGEYQKAKKAYTRAMSFGAYHKTYENMAGVLLLSGSPDETIQFLKKSLTIFPQDAKLWLYLAVVQYRQKNIEAAKTAVGQAYSYDQSPQITALYEKIMNGESLNVVLQVGNKKVRF